MKKILLSIMMLAAYAMGMAATSELTVADGTDVSSRVPFNSMWIDTEGTVSQVYYHADSLQDIPVGASIKGIKFYVQGNGATYGNARFQISMGEAPTSPYTSSSGPAAEGLTVVATDVLVPAGQLEVSIEFETAYVYGGGGLVFESKVTNTSTYSMSRFYGTNTPSTEDYTCFTRGSADRFIPKTTFVYEGVSADYAAVVSPRQLDFGKVAPNTEKEMTVTLHNTGLQPFTPAIGDLDAPFATAYVPAELAAGESVEIPVVFSPLEEGDFATTLAITYGAREVIEVAISGVASSELELLVSDGTVSSTNYPYKGTYTDTQGTTAQMIYPAQMLADAVGCQITGLKFYASNSLADLDGATLQIALAETEQGAYERENANSIPSNLIPEDAFTPVAEVVRVSGNNIWDIPFDTPYNYMGKNLVVRTLVTVAGSYVSTSFYGTNQDDLVSYSNWGSNFDTSNFLPKMTVVYKPVEETPVAVDRVDSKAAITSVRYVNTMGMVSDRPFSGVNIIVTERADGTRTTTKALY